MAIVFIRTIIVFAVLILSMRLMGKRQLGELELSEIVVAVLISDMASHPLQDIGVPLLNGLIPAVVLVCCEILITGGIMRSIRFRAFMCGRPSIIIENGKIIQKEMRKNRFCSDELSEELRRKGISDISKVKFAVLETDGTLSLFPYPAEKPPTAAMLGLTVEDISLPKCIISDGRLIERNLRECGLNTEWLLAELKSRGAADIKDVYLMSIDAQNKIFFAAMEKDA